MAVRRHRAWFSISKRQKTGGNYLTLNHRKGAGSLRRATW